MRRFAVTVLVAFGVLAPGATALRSRRSRAAGRTGAAG